MFLMVAKSSALTKSLTRRLNRFQSTERKPETMTCGCSLMPCESFNFKQNTCFFQIDRIKPSVNHPKMTPSRSCASRLFP